MLDVESACNLQDQICVYCSWQYHVPNFVLDVVHHTLNDISVFFDQWEPSKHAGEVG